MKQAVKHPGLQTASYRDDPLISKVPLPLLILPEA